jgi:hypothetical protein
MKGPVSTSTSSLVDDIAAVDGPELQMRLAKAQLEVGKVVKFMGKGKARGDYLVGLVNIIATFENTKVKYLLNPSRGTFYAKIWCASGSNCSVSHSSRSTSHTVSLT